MDLSCYQIENSFSMEIVLDLMCCNITLSIWCSDCIQYIKAGHLKRFISASSQKKEVFIQCVQYCLKLLETQIFVWKQ